MLLTERDLDILKFINAFGFCETYQLCRKFELQHYRVYRIMKRLVALGYVLREKILHAHDSTYRLTAKGARLTGLPNLNRISLANYLHTISLIDLSLAIQKRHPNATWISERYLKRKRYAQSSGKRGHCADAILVLNEKKIAIEVELTLKKQAYLDRIIKGYASDFSINEVWYFCDKKVLHQLRKSTKPIDYFKIIDFHDFLREEIRLEC